MGRRGELCVSNWRTDGWQASGGDLWLGNFPAAIICVSSNENWWQFELIADAVRTWHMVALISSAAGAGASQITQALLPKPRGVGGLQLHGGIGAWEKGGKVWMDPDKTQAHVCGPQTGCYTLYKVLFFHWIIFSVLILLERGFYSDLVCFQWLRGIIRQLLAKCIAYSRNSLCFEVFLCQGSSVALIRKCSTCQPLTSSSGRSVA